MQFRDSSIDGAAGYFPDRVRHASGCVLTYNDGFRLILPPTSWITVGATPPENEVWLCKLADFSVSNLSFNKLKIDVHVVTQTQ